MSYNKTIVVFSFGGSNDLSTVDKRYLPRLRLGEISLVQGRSIIGSTSTEVNNCIISSSIFERDLGIQCLNICLMACPICLNGSRCLLLRMSWRLHVCHNYFSIYKGGGGKGIAQWLARLTVDWGLGAILHCSITFVSPVPANARRFYCNT